MQFKFNYLDRVSNQQLGKSVIGQVFGIVLGGAFLETHDYNVDYSMWDEIYPFWREEVFYLILEENADGISTGNFYWFPQCDLFTLDGLEISDLIGDFEECCS